MPVTAHIAARLFDGAELRDGHALLVEDGRISGVVSRSALPPGATVADHGDGTLCPGFVDLQVNGGGGVMFNDDPSVTTLRRIAEAHLRLGTKALLPTLITDRPEVTQAAIEAACAAIDGGVPGIAGLHLEGPHLSIARKGAHDPALIRPMQPADLDRYLDAAGRLPSLTITLAAETVLPEQIAALSRAGVIVSLGHSDADFDTCRAAIAAGARCVTHLFNAMSQLGSREPGLVGAALASSEVSAGLIADAIHVHPAAIAAALRAKAGPGGLFLVTDAMATAGSDIDGFSLNGRRIERRDGRLTLADGTLAGADLDMGRALRVMTGDAGLPLPQALAMATARPAQVLGRFPDLGSLTPGQPADFVLLSPDLRLSGVWRSGDQVDRE